MKQLVILSGKGGTGKTTVASSFIKLAQNMAFADCDVDAPNLHLVMSNKSLIKKEDYYGFGKACIDYEKCIKCGLCEKNCHFEAITDLEVSIFDCEGCGVCEAFCPTGAITLKDHASGELTLYNTDNGLFSTAQLKMGSGASGKLVTAVKTQLSDKVTTEALTIIDGSPGIGCSVIASINGAHMVLIVTEPTIFGISDMERIIKTAKGFEAKTAICVNKYDLNLQNTDKIKKWCFDNNIPYVGEIPFDPMAVEAINNGKTVAEYPDIPSFHAIKNIFNNTIKILNN
jgi:MinD superfamily P-loop ATPase